MRRIKEENGNLEFEGEKKRREEIDR